MNMMQRRRRLVVVGNGMAGMRTVEELLRRAPGGFDITVFGAEPHGNYNRIMLSPVLSGEKSFAEIQINDLDWYAGNDVRLIAGEAALSIDRAARTVTGAAGTVCAYDVLLLATGSDPIILPVPGNTLPGVVSFRDMADVERMMAAASVVGAPAIVIGGGLLGLEAAAGLALRGMAVTVVHLAPTLMERQLDAAAASALQRDLEARGLAVLTSASTVSVEGTERVTGLRLSDGRVLPAELVVMAAGIRPNTKLAKAAGLATNRGVLVDEGLTTSDPCVFAVGECIEHDKQLFGLVAPIWEMAKVCADRIAGIDGTAFVPATSGTRLKVTGIDMFSAGAFNGGDGCDELVLHDTARNRYRRVVVRDDRVEGVVLYGDAADADFYFGLLRDRTPLGALRDTLILGPGFGPGAATDTRAALLALPDDAEICGCNGVSKGTIEATIREHGLISLDQVKARTKASASCGGCAGQVEQLLRAVAGGDASVVAVRPMCGCTALGHDQVRAELRARALRTIPQIVDALDWTTPDGCASCRPALNYYLLCEWPEDYDDDPQSRIMNERMHANIQKDGTYSVVPRMWGGTTNAAELRAIADVVDKFAIPTVKVTGGQRIDLLGVRKEQLPGVWADLNAAGLVSGHAYAKALRTVKTCVGSEWCRFGTQDSTAMGIALERMSWASWTPAKFKMAVSGCPRNCAESTIKDFGVIATDAGWDLLVGGNGGIKLRGTELLAKVTSDAEVLEYAGAFMQLYREEARYLERTAHWIERVGIGFVTARITDDPGNRAALHARFLHAQAASQSDPWAARVPPESTEAARYRPLAVLETL